MTPYAENSKVRNNHRVSSNTPNAEKHAAKRSRKQKNDATKSKTQTTKRTNKQTNKQANKQTTDATIKQSREQQTTKGNPAAPPATTRPRRSREPYLHGNIPPLQHPPPPMCLLAGYSRLCPTMPQAFGHATRYTCSGLLRRVRLALTQASPES